MSAFLDKVKALWANAETKQVSGGVVFVLVLVAFVAGLVL